MRKILFRGKRKDNGECIEGSAINTQYDVRGERHVYIGISICSETHPLMQTITWYAVDPETVGQFTGLYDATPWEELTTDEQALFLYPENGDKRSKEDWKGKPIFEGDIVKFCDIKGVINYGMGCYCVKTNKPDWRGRNNPAIDIVLNEYENELKVIGNIYDNPELLEVSK